MEPRVTELLQLRTWHNLVFQGDCSCGKPTTGKLLQMKAQSRESQILENVYVILCCEVSFLLT